MYAATEQDASLPACMPARLAACLFKGRMPYIFIAQAGLQSYCTGKGNYKQNSIRNDKKKKSSHRSRHN